MTYESVMVVNSAKMARRLPPLPSVGDIVRLYGLKAKASLSQNFLLDLNVTGEILPICVTVFET